MPTPGALFGIIVFGAIGLGAFVYGKKSLLPKAIVLGIALMVYPYFVSDVWMIYGIGAVLTTALFFPRR